MTGGGTNGPERLWPSISPVANRARPTCHCLEPPLGLGDLGCRSLNIVGGLCHSVRLAYAGDHEQQMEHLR